MLFWPNRYFLRCVNPSFTKTISFLPSIRPEYYDKNDKTLPTVAQMNSIWDVAWEDPPNEDTASQQEKDKYAKDLENLTWYVEKYTPRAVDDKYFPANIRPHERITSTCAVDGKQKIRVTIAREAYGLIQFENSRGRWLKCFEWEDEQKKLPGNSARKPPPSYNKKKEEETKDYKCKWSDHAQGQGTGWDPVVYSVYDLKVNKIAKWREEDAAKNFQGQDFAKKLCQICHGVNPDVPSASTSRKKRGRGKNDDDEECTPPQQPIRRTTFNGFRDD